MPLRKISDKYADGQMMDYAKPVMMKQKTFRSLLAFGVTIFLLVQEATVLAAVLGVPEKFQEEDQWCWAGTSQAIMQCYNKVETQTNIAEYGTNGHNTWNYLYGSDDVSPYYRKGINMILNKWGLSCTYGAYTMSQSDVQNQINSGRPFVIRWGWSGGGGHFIAGRGIEGNYVYYMDPWPGEGYKMALYKWVVDDGNHEWTHSLELTTSPQLPNLRYWNAPNGSFKVSPQSGLKWGDNVTIYYGFANYGTGDIPSGTRIHWRFYLSSNSTITTSDYYWKAHYSDSGLADGHGKYGNFTEALPSSPPSAFSSTGTVYIGMILDPLNEIIESNKSDNSNQGQGKDYSYVSISAGTAPSAPTNVSASDGTYKDKVGITWSASSGATSYEVWRAISLIATKTKIRTPSTTSYDDTSASIGTTYYYWVTAKNTWGTSGYSSYNTGYRAGTAPSASTNVSASDGTYTDKVRITWSASSGATSYEVWRAISAIGTKTKIGKPSTTSYDDASASIGTTYYYWVTAKNTWGTSGYSSYNKGYRDPCPDCSGGSVDNFTFKSGTNCECAATGTLIIGPGVEIESGATVTFKSPSIKVQSGFHADDGANVFMKQP